MSNYADLIAWLESGDDERELEAAAALREQAEQLDAAIDHANSRDIHIAALETERDALRDKLSALAESGTGYSQQTVDALTAERDALKAENAQLKIKAAYWEGRCAWLDQQEQQK